MSPDASGKAAPKSTAARVSAVVMWSLAFVAALGKAFEALPKIFLNEQHLWITEFLPDMVVALALTGIVMLVFPRIDIDWRATLRGAWAQSKLRRAGLGALILVMLAMAALLGKPVVDFYRVRHQRTFMDWPAVRVLDLIRVRDYVAAHKELKKASRKQAAGTLEIVERDMEGRFKDAEALLARFREHRAMQRSPTFEEVLMVGRAARLAPRLPSVEGALTDARKIVNEALGQYVRGVDRIRQGDSAGGAEALNRSRTACRGFLHQDLLIRYTQNGNLEAYSAEERGLIGYYLKTPRDKLEAGLLSYPPVQLFQARST